MILAGQLLLEDEASIGTDSRCRIAPGFVRTDGESIVEVVEGEVPANPDVGGANTLICPGFIDAHLHLAQFDVIGAHGMPLLDWLDRFAFPAEMKWSDADFARAMTRRVLSQLFAYGTTGICAFATVHHHSAVAALETATELGMRGVIGQVLMDREGPPELCAGAGQLLDEAERLGSLFPPGGRMSAAVTPRFAISCSRPLLIGAGELAASQRAMIQSHLAETLAECKTVERLFSGKPYVDVYREAGLLTAKAIYGHGIHLNETDRATIADAGAVIAHCPTANSFLRSGTMDRSALVNDGVRMAVGSDIGAGFERSMVRVGRAMIEAASSIGEDYPPASAAWHAITAGNADALGWEDAGRLKAGAAADLVVIEPMIPWVNSIADPLSTLLFGWDDRWVTDVVVRGQKRP